MIKEKNRKTSIAAIVIIAAAVSLLACAYQSCVVSHGVLSEMRADQFCIEKWPWLFLFSIMVMLCMRTLGTDKLFRFRYFIAICFFVLCVTFGITGSSIGCLLESESNLLFGVSRPIRSDEWAVFTPMTWSQYFDPAGSFSYYSSVLRACKTDVFIEYGLPISSWLMIFKPFLIGYLFLPIPQGMSFFWMGRLIALFMVSFEFGRYITKDDRLLSFVYAIMVAFAPCVQWWFAICGLVEMLIFFQLSLLCFDKYLKDDRFINRVLCSVIIGICALGYVLSMYPQWMIPLAYVLVACICAVLYENYADNTIRSIRRGDLLVIVAVTGILAYASVSILHRSGDAISTIMNTSYPGLRREYGGSYPVGSFLYYMHNLWFAVLGSSPAYDGNVCEGSQFITMFPLSFVLYIKNRIATRKRDPLSIALLVCSLFLMIFILAGLPVPVAAITLMDRSSSHRAIVILGFAQVIMLIRQLSLLPEKCEKGAFQGKNIRAAAVSAMIAISVAAASLWISYAKDPVYFRLKMILIEFLIFTPLLYLTIQFNSRVRRCWACIMVAVCLISGGLVNPVRMGVDDINNNEDLRMIREVVKNDPDAIWIVDDFLLPLSNLPIMAGARTVNCTNVYPALDRWKAVDKDNRYYDCYNRYAHIKVIRQNEQTDNEKFVLNGLDCFTVLLSDDEMKDIGVKYIFSRNNYADSSMKLIQTNRTSMVYELTD